MRKIYIILLFMSSLLYADSNDIQSKLVIDSERYENRNELQYGVTNNYSFLVAEHQIIADECLLFYYGTKVGIISQDYSAENGFGPQLETFGAIIKATIGLKYTLKHLQKISFDGSHFIDERHQKEESQLKLHYTYHF